MIGLKVSVSNDIINHFISTTFVNLVMQETHSTDLTSMKAIWLILRLITMQTRPQQKCDPSLQKYIEKRNEVGLPWSI